MATDDVAALQARIAELEQEKSAPRRRFDGRGFGAWTILIVAALLFPLALTAFWAQRTLLDTERYIETVAPLASDPTVQKAVGTTVTNALVKQLDTQNRVSELFTDQPRLQVLAGPIAIGVNNFVGTQVDNILASDQFDSVWVAINRQAQEALVRALSGDTSGAVSVQGDQVVLDTGDLINLVKARLVDRGLSFAANIPVPSRADREVVLLTSPQLRTAQTAYAIGQPIAAWLIYGVLLMFVIAVLVSRHRARTVMAVGIAIILGAIVMRLGMAFGQDQLGLTLAGTPFALAEQAFYSILTVFLLGAVRSAFVLGAVLAAIGWFLSGSAAAVKTRAFFGGLLSGAGAKASDSPAGEVGVWFARTRTFWRVLIVGVAAAVLLASDQISGSLILWTAVIAVGALVIVEFLAAAGAAATSAGTADTAEHAVDDAEPVEVSVDEVAKP